MGSADLSGRSAALRVRSARVLCAPSPPALGAPRPLRLVKAPAASHPLPLGERAGDFMRQRAAPLGEGWGLQETASNLSTRRGLGL